MMLYTQRHKTLAALSLKFTINYIYNCCYVIKATVPT